MSWWQAPWKELRELENGKEAVRLGMGLEVGGAGPCGPSRLYAKKCVCVLRCSV